MNGYGSPLSANLRTVGCALLTQTVWLPLVVIDKMDSDNTRRLTIEARAKGRANPASAVATAQPLWREGFRIPRTGALLNQPLAIASSGIDPLLKRPVSTTVEDGPGPRAQAPLFQPYRPLVGVEAQAAAPAPRPTAIDPITRAYTRAELLGGTLALDGLRSPLVPPLALAEQARYRASGDPLSPLPLPLRAPMRQAMQQLQPTQTVKVQQAKVTHVPSTRVKAPTQVPVAIQGDGSVDILAQPTNPAVVEEIRDWSKRQMPSARHTVTPAVVHLHPIPESPVQPSAMPAEAKAAPAAAAPAPEPSWTPVPPAEVSVVPPSPPPPVVEVSAAAPATPDQILP